MKVLFCLLILIPISLFGQKQIIGAYTNRGFFEDIAKEYLELYSDQYFSYFNSRSPLGSVASYGKFEIIDNKILLHYSKIYLDTTKCKQRIENGDSLRFPNILTKKKDKNWINFDQERKLVLLPHSNKAVELSWIGNLYWHIKPSDKECKFFLKRRLQLIKEKFICIDITDCQITSKQYFWFDRESLIEK